MLNRCFGIGLLGMVACYGSHAQAQAAKLEKPSVMVPEFSIKPAGRSTRPITAAEAATHVITKRVENATKLSFRSGHYPIDSMRSAVASVSGEWLARAQSVPITGIQL